MKKYYRLSELKDAFGISDGDVHYLNAETDVSFCLFCKTTDVILGGYKKGRFVGFGNGAYSGLISMNKRQQADVFEKNKVSIKQSTLLQKDKVTHYSIDYPFSVEVPNKILKEWLSTPFNEIHFNNVPFCFYPDERKSLMKQFYKMMDEFPGNENKSSLPPLSSYDPTKPIIKELFDNWQSFTFDDVCIIGDELDKAKCYLSGNSPHDSLEKSALVNITKKIRRPIDVLILSMLDAFPKDKPAVMWDKLKEDLNNDPRQYDVDETLDEVGEKELYWYDIEGEPQSLKRKSFYNLINKLKIN